MKHPFVPSAIVRAGSRLPALCLALVLSLSGAAHAQETTTPNGSNLMFAQQRYERGTVLYADRRYAEALEEFRASLDLYVSPNSRLAVARCLRELGRLPEAVLDFERAAGEAADRAVSDPRFAVTRDKAREELRAVEARIARVRVVFSSAADAKDARVTINDVVIPAGAIGLLVPVMPGDVHVQAERPSHARASRDLHVEPGRVAEAELRFAESPPTNGPRSNGTALQPGPAAQARPTGLRSAAWIAFGVGGAGLVSFTVFGILAGTHHANLESECGSSTATPRPCPAQLQGDVDRGVTYQTLTNVSLGIALGSAALGAGLLWFAPSSRSPTAVSAVPTRGGGTLALSRRF
jgi:hypothetical protein